MRSSHSTGVLAGIVCCATLVFGQSGIGPITTAVAKANPRQGHPATRIAAGYGLKIVTSGSQPLENPSGVITRFGFLNDFPPQPVEATKTESDENTYLVLDSNPGGPSEGFDYGRHFLFQGHELFSGGLAYVTRINLDVKDPAHRITLLTPVGNRRLDPPHFH